MSETLSAEMRRAVALSEPYDPYDLIGSEILALCDEAEALRAEVSRLREALEVISLHCENANWRQHARAALAAPVPQEPAACPTCGSPDKAVRDYLGIGSILNHDGCCDDAWHAAAPVSQEDPQ
jgi:hypothetical protein